MLQKTCKVFEKKQLSNKWENMKKEWKLYDRLMRLETGIGGTRGFIDAFEEWWAEKISDSVAIGDHSMTPLQFVNNNMEGSGDSDGINLGEDEVLFFYFPRE